MSESRISQGIREAIRACGVSRHVLARRVGIAPSILSRFLAGSSGLSLETADRLAEALGLQITSTIQNLPRPRPRGRRPTQGTQTVTDIRKKTDWPELAVALARDAHENHFESRRGVWHDEGRNVLCHYNNNPYQNDPTLRDEELAEFRRRMAEKGVEELAYATYPPAGQEGAGYTFAQILDAGEERTGWVVETLSSILAESRGRMDPPAI